jgi:hypothetical protein
VLSRSITLRFPLTIDISLKFKPLRIFLGFDHLRCKRSYRTLNGGGDDFDCGMIDGGIDRGKSGFFSGVDDAIFEGGVFSIALTAMRLLNHGTFISANS